MYALRSAPLRELADALSRLAESADRTTDGPRATYDRYGLSLRAERLAAEGPGWADGRSFAFRRSAPGRPGRGRRGGARDRMTGLRKPATTALPAADEADRLALTVFPVFLGGGPRLFDDGLPGARWALVGQSAGEHGTLALVYDRIR
ncbi:hypothetical protein GCM10010387_34640 [Streptomyces inusitatus]|uniref:Uncharacterized protein n=1 Tax=Streptomyces inusitatus TaxID=68221 RepID=A0A918UVL4_9ACTN|nr:hypothetical protein [Streptomyces inusitatus]GGZ37538.1 hypothetical protein GCM10010387_34640 [Streptomyces inusitatus]